MSIDAWRIPRGVGTHVLMNGGILFVHDHELDDFYRSYVEALSSGSKLYVVEQKTERFKFFVDLDYKAKEKLNDEDLLQFCTIIHEALNVKSPCLIARARPRPIADSLVKSGVHIHWPELVVTRTEAMNLRTKIIAHLSQGYSFDWNAIIDASVYGGSGLRMLWSHKKPTGDPYVPWRQLGSDRVFSKEPNVETLSLFSVRVRGDVEKTHEIFENTDQLETFIRKYIEGQSSLCVKRAQRHDHDGWFVQTDSTYCERIRRSHKSNHVWFSIKSGRISQRCFDDECREFKGSEYILPPSIVDQLKDVAVVGSPSTSFLMDIFPDGSTGSFQKIRTDGPSVFGSGPNELETFFGQPARIRTVGFDASG